MTQSMKPQCEAKTKKGTQCKQYAKIDGLCAKHSPIYQKKRLQKKNTKPQCEATTKKGIQCKHNARKGGKFCSQHFLMDQEKKSIVKKDETNYPGSLVENNGSDYKYKLDKNDSSLEKKLNNILSKFHSFVLQLGLKDQNGNIIQNSDVSGIIDVLPDLLKKYFKNIEISIKRFDPNKKTLHTPYLLLPENNAVIVAKTTKNLTKEQIQNLSKYDFKSFKNDSSCNILYYFIYDPGKKIEGAKRFQGNLSGKEGNFVVRVIVSQ